MGWVKGSDRNFIEGILQDTFRAKTKRFPCYRVLAAISLSLPSHEVRVEILGVQRKRAGKRTQEDASPSLLSGCGAPVPWCPQLPWHAVRRCASGGRTEKLAQRWWRGSAVLRSDSFRSITGLRLRCMCSPASSVRAGPSTVRLQRFSPRLTRLTSGPLHATGPLLVGNRLPMLPELRQNRLGDPLRIITIKRLSHSSDPLTQKRTVGESSMGHVVRRLSSAGPPSRQL